MSVHPALNNAEIHRCGTFTKWLETMQCSPEKLEQIVHFLPTRLFICDDHGELLVDRIYHYETIGSEWADLCGHLGLTPQPLPRINPSKSEFAPDGVSESLAAWIADVYADDFRLGEYRLEAPAEISKPL